MTSVGHTGLDCLSAVARHYGVDLPSDKLVHEYGLQDRPVTPEKLARIAKDAGFRAQSKVLDWSGLAKPPAPYPAMARLNNGNWVLILGPLGEAGKDHDAVAIFDPLAENANALRVTRDSFLSRWDGTMMFLRRAYALTAEDQPFGFRWFIPELVRERRLFRDVAVAALVLHLLGFATPLFFQIMVDKVIVHEAYATLHVLAIGIVVALVFDAVFTYLRRYLLLFATNRIDIRVGARTFRHLLGLPVQFFEQRSAGVIVKHLQQSERVREFLTGRLFITLLDSLSLFVFIPLLLVYSVKLTLVVLGFALLVTIIVCLLVAPYRRRLNALYAAEAARQGLLVETVHGIQTVKALAIEPLQRRSWDDQLAHVAELRFGVERISTSAQAIIQLTERLMSVAIICLGTLEVFDGTLTVGALIAFNMLAGRVSGPLVQVANTIHEYQEKALSVHMLGEVMNQRLEQPANRNGLRPLLAGRIEFEDVVFRYAPERPPALEQVSFVVQENKVLGVVGRSGSGKTTITRLIQGLHRAQQGIIRIDGTDVREIDLPHLRRSIGVVLQENFLFRGTVRDNIAVTKPDATLEDIFRAAHTAGADEFIQRLPHGLNTIIEENGANLSGGQRQRIAIARALLTDPRILIFDEATSALDPDSEAIIRNNLAEIAKGRTVIIVSHRLSSLVGSHAILVLDQGRIVDLANHDTLLSRCMTYRQLWSQQNRHIA